jgi:ELWxxDGT repeat protein
MENHKMHHTTPTLSRQRYLIRVCCLVMSLLLGFALIVPAQAAGPAFLVKNINTTPNPSPSSSPANLVAIGNTVYFSALSKGYRGLWKSDGTAAGTVLVKEINSTELTNLNGTLFFVATDGITGNELWKSDGTAAGTVLVKAINAGQLTNLNGTLFFVATDGATGYELWKSDGTAAGTVLVKDILDGQPSSYPSNLTNVNGTLFFIAQTADEGRQLWKSNGTAAGTQQVTIQRNRGPHFFNHITRSHFFTNVNGTLFFSTFKYGDEYSPQLWKSNGTLAGTTMLKEVLSNVLFVYLTNVNGTLFFRGQSQLWKSNGTVAGTSVVKDIPASQLLNRNGKLFFLVADGANSGLWQSDGTDSGTTPVKSIGTPYTDPLGSLISVNGTLFLTTRSQLWKSDGTPAGTTLIFSATNLFDVGSTGHVEPQLTNANGRLFFVGRGSAGDELWKSDGTTVSTGIVRDIEGPQEQGVHPRNLTPFKGKLIFTTSDGTGGVGLWQSDSTPAGTTQIKAAASDTFGYDLMAVEQTLFMIRNQQELWKSDGTPTGTTLIRKFDSIVYSFNQLNGVLFFLSGGGLWRSDGTAAGTTLVKQVTTVGQLYGLSGCSLPTSRQSYQMASSRTRAARPRRICPMAY